MHLNKSMANTRPCAFTNTKVRDRSQKKNVLVPIKHAVTVVHESFHSQKFWSTPALAEPQHFARSHIRSTANRNSDIYSLDRKHFKYKTP